MESNKLKLKLKLKNTLKSLLIELTSLWRRLAFSCRCEQIGLVYSQST